MQGVVLSDLIKYPDNRGYFMEVGRDYLYPTTFIQENQSGSWHNVIRGLHYQDQPKAQAKAVRVIRGKIFDVIVDLRKNSETFGKWNGYYLCEENPQELYIPQGFAHGFLVVSSFAEVLYKVDNYYSPEYDRTLLWNDPYLNIPWPVEDPIISKKDQNGKFFLDCDYYGDDDE